MKVLCVFLMVFVASEALMLPIKSKGSYQKGSLLKRGSWKSLKVAGETSVGIASLTAALAILNSIESNADPTDAVLMEKIAKERKRLMALQDTDWVPHLAVGGSVSSVIIVLVFLIVFRAIRRKRSRDGNRSMNGNGGEIQREGAGLQFGDIQVRHHAAAGDAGIIVV